MQLERQAHRVLYQGHAYDSRLEADWAHTMDVFKIKYKPHPGRLPITHTTWYEPDFHVLGPGADGSRDSGALLEIKGGHNERIDKVTFACHLGRRYNAGLVVVGREVLPDGTACWERPPGSEWRDEAVLVRWHDGSRYFVSVESLWTEFDCNCDYRDGPCECPDLVSTYPEYWVSGDSTLRWIKGSGAKVLPMLSSYDVSVRLA